MPYFKNRRGQTFRTGSGGTYPMDNDPQNYDDELEPDTLERQESERIDHLLSMMDE